MIKYVSAALLSFASLNTFAQTENSHRGHTRIYFNQLNLPKNTYGLSDSQHQLTINQRHTWLHSESDLHMEVAYEFFVSQFDANNDIFRNALSQNTPYDYRLRDINPILTQTNSDESPLTQIKQNLDRLYIVKNWAHNKLSVGRQIINFGSGRMVSPEDVLAPFGLMVFETEQRFGIDAIRYQHAFNAIQELDIGHIAGSEGYLDRSATYAQFKSYSWSALMMQFKKHNMLGVDIQNECFEWNCWIEGAYVEMQEDYKYFRWSMGAEKLFFWKGKDFVFLSWNTRNESNTSYR
ncbi:MAG: hypothetical protein R2827_11145 [Bdellovibrionales bacterium]